MINIIDFFSQKNLSAKNIMPFLLANDFFGFPPIEKDGIVYVTDETVQAWEGPLSIFCTESGLSYLTEQFTNKFPVTAAQLSRFCADENIDKDDLFYILDFLLYNLQKELIFYTDSDLQSLIDVAVIDLTKSHGDILTFFLAWLRVTVKTAYRKDYILEKRYTMEFQNSTYDVEEYMKLAYYLFSPTYIASNDMYYEAANSIDMTDTWLYLSLHYICALRLTDLERIYHPQLPYDAVAVLDKIRAGTFTVSDSRYVLLSITQRMATLPLTVSKTAGTSGVGHVHFNVPKSCEHHFGILFACAEAHRIINGTPNAPIIRKVSEYRLIKRYMGEDIGDLFLQQNFHARSATKSFLQAIEEVADGLDGNKHRFYGSLIAGRARSHKGDFQSFAATTVTYLKDASFNGLTPELVAFELLDRGVLSSITGQLLDIVTGGEYRSLSPKKQTSLIKESGLSPLDTESFTKTVALAEKRASEAIRMAIGNDKESILSILHRIGSGDAFSKTPESLCLLTACYKLCACPERSHCVGCTYEIQTFSTLYLLIEDKNRMTVAYHSSTGLEKEKYKKLLLEVLAPQLKVLLAEITSTYGEEVLAEYSQFIKELSK